MEMNYQKGERRARVRSTSICRAFLKAGPRLLMIGVLLGSAFFLHSGIASPGNVWYGVFAKPFYSNQGDNRVLAMAAFNGAVYAGTGRWGGNVPSASIYSLVSEGCKLWDYTTPPWSQYTSGKSMAMSVFKNYLYVGTDQGEVWRTGDGLKWSNVTGNWIYSWGPGIADCISDMAEFKGNLYISFCGNGIWRTSDGSSWNQVPGPSGANINDLSSLEAFNGYLYAGVGLKIPSGSFTYRKGIQLWRSVDGKNWNIFKGVVEPADGLSAYFYPEHVHALSGFKGYLYLGEYHGQGLYRTDGSATSWNYVPNAITEGKGSVFRLAEHAGKLYLGASHLAPPDAPGVPGTRLLFSSTNGTQWQPVSGSPTVSNNCSSIISLLSHGGKLYVGTDNPSISGWLEIQALGPAPAPICQVGDIGMGVDRVVAKTSDIINIVREYFPHLPPLEVLPPIGPIPPGPYEGEWEFVLVSDIIRAVHELEIPPEAEEVRELILQHLEAVEAEVGLAMSILFEAVHDVPQEELQWIEQPDVSEEVIAHLEIALQLCGEIFELLPPMGS
jgi:hypothetical protein